VQALDVTTIPLGGTDLADAINTALAAYKEGDACKALVLLTDGEETDNDAAALEAARRAAQAGLKIFTVGVGTVKGDLVRVTDASGNSDYVRDEQGNVHQSKLDEPLLQQLAAATGGFYLPLRGADTMDILYERGLAPLPKNEGQERLIRRYHEQFHWPLAAAMLLLLAELFLPERRGSKVPGPKPKVAAAVTAVLLAVPAAPGSIHASPASALHEYRSGNFTNALEEYSRLAEVRTNDLRLLFNAGDAAYRATNFDLAGSLFERATLSADLALQEKAFYNLGNAQFQLARGAKDLDGLQAGLEAAAKTYGRAVELDRRDADAAYNLAFTTNAVEQIKQFREAIRRAKSEADTAVRRAEFHRALEIMLPLQKTIAAKQFEDFTKKLKDIDDIANPHQP